MKDRQTTKESVTRGSSESLSGRGNSARKGGPQRKKSEVLRLYEERRTQGREVERGPGGRERVIVVGTGNEGPQMMDCSLNGSGAHSHLGLFSRGNSLSRGLSTSPGGPSWPGLSEWCMGFSSVSAPSVTGVW